jgi:alpha-1,2-mannosyltransferase
MSFFLGQMDALILLLLMLALRSGLQGRDGRAGAWVGAAAAIKLSPVLILGFFAARRRWSALGGAAMVLTLCLLVEVAIVGPGTMMHFATQVLPVLSKGSASIENQSLQALMYRLVTPRSALLSMDAMPDYPAVRFVWAAVSITIVGITLYLARRATLDRPAITAIALGTFIVVTVLVGAISWDHYMIWAQLLVIAMAVDWFETQWMSRREFWSLFSAGAFLMMCPFVAQVIGTYGLLLFLALAWSRLWHARRPAESML